MKIHVFENKTEMGDAAAHCAAQRIRQAVDGRGEARIILATGASQFEFLDALVKQDLPWNRVEAFHLDEYVGLPADHPASFRRYLRERFVDRVPELSTFHWVRGDAGDLQAECERLGALISRAPIDLACIGIGENGHLAFNDPPADFETDEPYIVVELDEACRRQQLGEGWFDTLDDVPERAISMSIRQVMQAGRIVCTVPDERKAPAVRNALEGPLTNECPASILREHGDCHLFLDQPAASLLESH
jgi:glucosamine-6-phosphate deaminase